MNTPQKGVGPWQGEWPDDSRYDPELLAHGDTRNVADRFRYLNVEAIRAVLAATRSRLHVAIENWERESNIGTIVRTANALNVGAVHIVGRRQWNKRGAMVTDRYIDVFYHPTITDFAQAVAGKAVIAADNLPGARLLHGFAFPKDCVLVFGSERDGLSPEMAALAETILEIEQRGSTRSLNAGVAAGIVMYAWQAQHVLDK